MYLNEFDATMKHIQGKWKVMILYEIFEKGVVRFNELQRYIIDVSHKTLTNQLRELEKDGLILRKVYNEVPLKVEYKLSKKGESIIPLLNAICKWGLDNVDDDLIERNLCE